MFCLAIPLTSVFVGATYYDYTENMEYVALPFPSPDNFSGDVCGSQVFWDKTNGRYEYWVVQVMYSDDNSSGVVYTRDGVKLDTGGLTLTINNNSDVTVSFTILRFWFYPSQSTYSFWSVVDTISPRSHYTYTGQSGTTLTIPSLMTFGDLIYSGSTISGCNTSYTFNNDISPYIFKQMSSDLGEIKLYCSEILEALGGGSDYAPPETTTNAVVDGYNQAEQELMNNQFNNIDNVVDNLPDLNGGDLGPAYNNSFAFVSNMMNFVSGNGSGYGSASSSMAKISGVILVILSLGFTSFIIGLVNRRKE